MPRLLLSWLQLAYTNAKQHNVEDLVAQLNSKRAPASSSLLVCAGLQMANLDVKVLRAIFDLVQNHYPEHLAALWFLNAPFIFRTVWGGVQALLQPSTREKIRFLSGRSGNDELLKCVSLAVSLFPLSRHSLRRQQISAFSARGMCLMCRR